MTEFFRIKNWEKFQHYKDRMPPWIKLYNDLLDDFEFSCLQDASKLHLILIWLLASRTENRIPWSPKWIRNKVCIDSDPNLDELQRAGFIEKIPNENSVMQQAEQDASDTLATRKQDACLETETETDKNIPDLPKSGADEVYRSKRDKKLEGRILEAFNRFWEAFDLKQGKAEAADAFLTLVDQYRRDKSQMPIDLIIEAAKAEAAARPGLIASGRTAKWAQGWLSGRRWEAYQPKQTQTPEVPMEPSKADWILGVRHFHNHGEWPVQLRDHLDKCPDDIRSQVNIGKDAA